MYLGQVNERGETPAEAFARLTREAQIREAAGTSASREESITQLAREQRYAGLPTTTLAPITTTAAPSYWYLLLPVALWAFTR